MSNTNNNPYLGGQKSRFLYTLVSLHKNFERSLACLTVAPKKAPKDKAENKLAQGAANIIVRASNRLKGQVPEIVPSEQLKSSYWNPKLREVEESVSENSPIRESPPIVVIALSKSHSEARFCFDETFASAREDIQSPNAVVEEKSPEGIEYSSNYQDEFDILNSAFFESPERDNSVAEVNVENTIALNNSILRIMTDQATNTERADTVQRTVFAPKLRQPEPFAGAEYTDAEGWLDKFCERLEKNALIHSVGMKKVKR